MKKAGMLLALCFAFSLAMMAQDNMGGMGQSADQTTTTTTKHHKMKGAKEHSLTGCLSEGTEPGTFVLTHGKHKTMLTGSDELKNHVGHEVKVTGAWEEGAMAESNESAATEANEKKSGKEEHELKVSNIQHISDTCTTGKMKKHKSSTGAGTGF